MRAFGRRIARLSQPAASARRVLPVVFVTLMLDMVGLGILFPIIPILFTDASSPSFMLAGYSPGMQFFLAGLAIALFGLLQFLAAPLLGELSDSYGRKRLLAIGVNVLALSQLLFGLAVVSASLPLLFFSRAVGGLAGANFSIAQAAIADVSAPEDRAKNFGLIGAAFGLGFIIGPVLGGWILHLTGNAAAPFWLAAALGALNFASVMLLMPETRAVGGAPPRLHPLRGLQNIAAAFAERSTRRYYAASLLFQSGFSFFTSFIGILLVASFGFAEVSIGSFFGIVGISELVTQTVILRWLTRRYSERQILKVSLAMLALAVLCYPFFPKLALIAYCAVPLVGVPSGLTRANLGALISRSAPAGRQGVALGINGSLIALAQGVSPFLAGLGSSALGVATPFVIGSVLVFSAWGVLFLKPRPAAH